MGISFLCAIQFDKPDDGWYRPISKLKHFHNINSKKSNLNKNAYKSYGKFYSFPTSFFSCHFLWIDQKPANGTITFWCSQRRCVLHRYIVRRYDKQKKSQRLENRIKADIMIHEHKCHQKKKKANKCLRWQMHWHVKNKLEENWS